MGDVLVRTGGSGATLWRLGTVAVVTRVDGDYAFEATVEGPLPPQSPRVCCFQHGGQRHATKEETSAYWKREHERQTETVETAAIRVEGEVWTLPRPVRHHVLFRAWLNAHAKRDEFDAEEGFVTNKGRFVNRGEAEDIARASGQLVGDIIGGELTSEDLW